METKIDIPPSPPPPKDVDTSTSSKDVSSPKWEEEENPFDMQVGCPGLVGFAIGSATWLFAIFLFFIDHRGRRSKAFQTGVAFGILMSTVIVILFLVFALGVNQ